MTNTTRTTGDLLTARACHATAAVVVATSIVLATTGHWVAAVLLLWLAPSLILVGVRARRAHTKRTTARQETDVQGAVR